MIFANPFGLLGLLAIPLVVALHLLRERRQRYVVSSLERWSFLQEEVRGALPRQIPFSLLLLVDILIAAALSLAWARPQVPVSTTVQEARQVIVLMDVSTSMLARDAAPTRFAAAQQAAQVLLSQLGPRDVVSVLAFGSAARLVGDTRQVSLGEVVQRVRDLQAGETGSNIDEALAAAQALADPRLPVEMHIFTDQAYPQPRWQPGDTLIDWRKLGQDTGNQAVLSVSTLQLPGGRLQVFARFANFGIQPASRPATLLVDGAVLDTLAVDLPADSTITRLWQLAATPEVVSVKLDGSDALPEDDRYTEVLQEPGTLRAVLVTENPEPLAKALRSVPGVQLRVLPPAEYSPSLSYDLTVFRGALPSAWPRGAVLVVDPPLGQRLLPVSGSVEITGQPVPDPSGPLGGIDFSGVQWGRAWEVSNEDGMLASLLDANGAPLLLSGRTDGTRLYVLAADLSAGNLTRHPAFPILIASLVQQTRPSGWPAAIQAGQPLPLPVDGDLTRLRLALPDDTAREWNSGFPGRWSETTRAGLYEIETVNRDGAKTAARVAVNAGNKDESDLRPRSWSLEAGPAEAQVSRQQSDVLSLTPYLLGLALALLALEAWLAWR